MKSEIPFTYLSAWIAKSVEFWILLRFSGCAISTNWR